MVYLRSESIIAGAFALLSLGSAQGAAAPRKANDANPAGVATIVANSYHTCALTSTGIAKCWGSGQHGQVGYGKRTGASASPQNVVDLGSGMLSIDTGTNHSCAVTPSGGAMCWGLNTEAQLGNTIRQYSARPVQVFGLESGVKAVAARYNYACALTANGAVKCWGGVFGTGGRQFQPVAIEGLQSGVASISAGALHTCIVTTRGAAKCWGANGNGELGDGTKTSSNVPVQVSGLGSGVAAISAGYGYTCAVTTGGAAKCWGYNKYGQLGDGTLEDRLRPVTVAGLSTNAATISAGAYNHTCAVTVAGQAKCWGGNEYGQLGDGTKTSRTSPVDVSNLGIGVLISAGSFYSCALIDTGRAKCWGNNQSGRLGTGKSAYSLVPVEVVNYP